MRRIRIRCMTMFTRDINRINFRNSYKCRVFSAFTCVPSPLSLGIFLIFFFSLLFSKDWIIYFVSSLHCESTAAAAAAAGLLSILQEPANRIWDELALPGWGRGRRPPRRQSVAPLAPARRRRVLPKHIPTPPRALRIYDYHCFYGRRSVRELLPYETTVKIYPLCDDPRIISFDFYFRFVEK